MKKMKKLTKVLCLLLSAIFSVTIYTACSEKEGSVNKEVDLTNAPDYSACTEEFTMFAYSPICDDWYGRNGERTYLDESLATIENLQKYADCGFNYLYVDYVFQENSMAEGYDFQTGKLKKIMDMAEEVGLKCVVFQPNIQALSNCEQSRINETEAAKGDTGKGLFFNSQEELNAYVATALEGLKDHPAFDGVILVDEPKYTKFQAIGEVYQAVKAAVPDAFVMQNLLPFAENSNQHLDLYCGSTEFSAEEAYRKYLDEYYDKVGKYMGYVMYDDYPILQDGVLPTFLYCNDVVSDFCAEKGLKRITIYQTMAYSNRRPVQDADIFFQMNVGMAFGNKSYSYYTYYPCINTAEKIVGDENTNYFVDFMGNPNPKYYTFQAFSKEMQFNAKALMNFEYCGMQYQIQKPVYSQDYLNRLENDEFELLKGYSFEMKVQGGGVVLVTELYDKTNDRYGYYVVNVTDPQFTSEAVVELDFGSYNYAQVYQFGQATNTCTNKGKLKIGLGSGRGAFVMPF